MVFLDNMPIYWPYYGKPQLQSCASEEKSMLIGTVINTIKFARCNPHLSAGTVLLVKSQEQLLPALDRVGATAGDRVLVVTGSAAEKYCMDAPADAAVIAILDTTATE